MREGKRGGGGRRREEVGGGQGEGYWLMRADISG